MANQVLKILVKDDPERSAGLYTIHGITGNDLIAQAWESGSRTCRCVEVNTEESISSQGLAMSDRLC
jgi:hypothetical protein